MTIGLFLDVDDTLTKGPIQSYFARALGVFEQYEVIEQRYQTGSIDSAAFAQAIIGLYQGADFNRVKCEEIARTVVMKPWAERLLKLDRRDDVDVYLVSSGPSFYIRKLAERYNIPEERVKYSTYDFTEDGKLSGRYDPVSPQGKSEFVRKSVARHFFTVGIGDSVYLDGPFLSHCTIKLLTEINEDYLYTPSFEIVLDIIDKVTSLPAARGALDMDKVTIESMLRTVPRLTLGSIAFLITIAGALVAASRLLG